MKYIRQFIIIILISFVGEVLHYLLPLPISASIYGLVLMLVGLASGLIPLAAVKDTAYFLVETMPRYSIRCCSASRQRSCCWCFSALITIPIMKARSI